MTTAAGSGWASARYRPPPAERVALTAASAVQGAGRPLQMRVVGYNIPTSRSPRTATGTTPRWDGRGRPAGHSLGSRLLIEGFEGVVFVAEDTGSAVSGNLIDVWFDDPATASGFGTQSRTVTVLGQKVDFNNMVRVRPPACILGVPKEL